MKYLPLTLAIFAAPVTCMAETQTAVIADIVDSHILPRFEALASSTRLLSDTLQTNCDPNSDTLRVAYGAAFDAWVAACHLRFGPTETEDRAFALAFWPDSRGTTPRVLSTLLSDQDPIASSAEAYTQVSIAARGFYAMEFMLYDDALIAAAPPSYHCQLVQTIGVDIAVTSQSILDDWQATYAIKLRHPSSDGPYRNDEEVLQQLFKSLSTGLQFTSETRLGRPLGTFDRPRPARAEARRSGRSAKHVKLTLRSLQNLATRLADGDGDISKRLGTTFDRALSELSSLDDPTFASVSDPHARLKVEVIQQSIEEIRTLVRDELGPTLGVAAGFNSLDGD